MNQSKPANGFWRSTAAVVTAALIDGCNARLARIGLVATAIDIAVCEIFSALGARVELAQSAGFFFFTLIFAVMARRIFPQFARADGAKGYRLYVRLSIFALLALLVRNGAILSLVVNSQGHPGMAIFAANLIGDATFVFAMVVAAGFETADSMATPWAVIAFGVLVYTFVLKLVFTACLNLIPEEAYYWNYAQHLDIGYLDHPPLVAWLIWLSTSLLGKSEFAVRLPAFICWFIAAAFMIQLTLNLCDRSAAYRGVLLLAVLPIYFGLGFFMTPDAPLFATWASSLYFIERALLGQDGRAWRWLGLSLGLGMLSKYPIALLGVAIPIFLIVDRQSRRWLFRREPYWGALIALILFSPVVLWNIRNDWISFAFQGSNRWTGNHHFGFHILIGSILLLLTPIGLFGIVRVLLPRRARRGTPSALSETADRQYLWTVIFVLAPLSVFVVYSLINVPKLNWTAPVWLAAIPLLARDMGSKSDDSEGGLALCSWRLWVPTIVVLLFIHGGFLNYVSLGLPGAGPMVPERLFGAWRELANKVDRIESAVEAQTGAKPIVVGMDKNFISSELSFYHAADKGGPFNTGGMHFFGGRSLMWELWFPRSAAVGRDFLLVDFDRKRILSPGLSEHFAKLSDVSIERLTYLGRTVGHFYWRVGHAYRG